MEDLKKVLTIYTEATPNPETMKFVVNRMILPDSSADYPNREAAKKSPLAAKLFEFSFVEGVFIMNNFITITRSKGSDWFDINPILKEFIHSYVEAGDPVVSPDHMEHAFDENDPEVVSRIKELLDTHVKPAVEMDGGAISFKSYEDGVVTVSLKGSCSGCPSSTVTLKAGIEGLLKRMVPEVKEVVAESV
jgi:NFU1 iron-sulfur cluster scaffold homolog, mitochondrial